VRLEPEHRKALETLQGRLQRRFGVGKITQRDAVRYALLYTANNEIESK